MRKWVWPLLIVIGLFMPGTPQAVVILDSTWREEGGRSGREADGFTAHIKLANEPQFRSLVALSDDGGKVWGVGSGTWIGNDDAHGYVLAAAHSFDDTSVHDILFRTDGGSVLRGDSVWLHPGYQAEGDRTGVDLAVVRLRRPVTDAGPPPVLYAGDSEKGHTITFIGFGTRGIGSVGEDERYNQGSDKAAAQGLVDEVVPLRQSSSRTGESGNYLSVFMPREDGGIANPLGGSRRPVSRLVGLLGSGDSGGSAWMPLGGGWVIVGVNSAGDGNAEYGNTSWFVRVSGARSWIASIFAGARFVGDADLEPSRPEMSATSSPMACRARERLFVFSQGAWYPAKVRDSGGGRGTCGVRFDGYSADDDEVVGRDRMIPWTVDGPGTALADCRPGVPVVAEEDGVWYPAVIATKGKKGCVVKYKDKEYGDETLPLKRLRTLR